MAGSINPVQIHVGPSRLWLNVCAPASGSRLLIDANGVPQQTVWAPTTQYGAGQMIVDSGGHIELCIQSGQSKSGGAPGWPTTVNTTTTDGTVIWQLLNLFPVYTFVGATRGAANVMLSPKNLAIMADQATAAIDAVMTAEIESIEAELLESDFTRLANYVTQGTFGSGTDSGLPAGTQSYEEIAFGGTRSVPKMSIALISPRRDVINKYVVLQLYIGYQADQIQLPFTREKETLFKIKYDGLWVDYRPIGDTVGKIYRQV